MEISDKSGKKWMFLFLSTNKKVENYEAMLLFSCGAIVWNKILLGWCFIPFYMEVISYEGVAIKLFDGN
ncbi:hypothetical protein EHN07_05845 [Buttiauxella warmboldiae]|uniref:Uncharacterized protein n=1 Tax=Buttiauxella warmboldiae TaxID=82993 RepID=A0A3N5DLH1_9ENTR|nr:hypothetical protein [Buttiauxella warmboldiae]RPH29458.1 hypothetical protein EHN07_05845 [Buttiauxella warmboldiae]